jgi:glutamyl-tRNA synthetase
VIRARFAPSPTGYLHVGSARTALFNWLFCRSVGGRLVLRIEDTDQARNQAGLVDNILEVLTWLGIDWDEGPFFQSQRADRHRQAVDQLLGAGAAYVDDGAVRFRVPPGTAAWDDVVRGRVEFDNANLEDFVIQRSDGSAMFLLANVVDDADMGITHVIRGEDMVNNTPKQLLLRRALAEVRGEVVDRPGSQQSRPAVMPGSDDAANGDRSADDVVTYAHLPLLVDDRRRKLSKRFGDVSVESYRERGFVAEALANYLALLGWGPPDGVEIRPLPEIVERFRLEDVNKAGAFFDIKKLAHINGTYLRNYDRASFAKAAEPWGYDIAVLPATLQDEVRERAHTLGDVPSLVDWYFLETPNVDPAAWEKATKGGAAAEILDRAVTAFAECPWDASELHARLAAVGEGLGLKLAKAQAPVRVAVTGRAVGPPLFESLEALGRERTLARLRAARARL